MTGAKPLGLVNEAGAVARPLAQGGVGLLADHEHRRDVGELGREIKTVRDHRLLAEVVEDLGGGGLEACALACSENHDSKGHGWLLSHEMRG